MGGQGGLKVSALNGVKVYTVFGPKALPSWVPPSKLRALRKDDEYLRRIELIQDLSFDTAATRIKTTPDGCYMIASGVYPPQVKVYELRHLSMKFERHLDAEMIDFQVLGDDYSKLAFLCADRSVYFHAKYGSHYQMRIPRMGRDLTYDRLSCDLLVAASSPDLYRINLEQGRFLTPLGTRSPGINVVGRSPVHGLIACGGEDGAVECFDLRQKAAVGRIDAVASTMDADQEVTALRFDETEGLLLAVGSSSGKVLLYDLRSPNPLHIKDHMYGSPIIDLKWHESLSLSKRQIISADHRVIRIWDPETGNNMTNLEPAAGEINDVCIIHNSGLIFTALDSPQILSYFIPSLGPAPKWCSYLENLTEELEEGGQTTIYEDFKFVTRGDIEKLNLTNLIGTNLLHAYMHGFFMDHRLFTKAKALAEPFAYDVYRQRRIQEKLDAERAARITIKRRLPKVNKELAARFLAASNEDGENDDTLEGSSKEGSVKKKKIGPNLFKDERFAAMFTDEAFEVDDESPEYKALHPNSEKTKTPRVQEYFDPLDASDSDQPSEKESESESESDHVFSEDDLEEPISKKSRLDSTKNKSGKNSASVSRPRLYTIKDEAHAEAFKKGISLAAEQALPLEKRIILAERKAGAMQQNKFRGGSREFSFISKSKVGKSAYRDSRKKRGVATVGLRSNRRNFGDNRGKKKK